MKDDRKLSVVSIRLKKNSSIMSDIPLENPIAAVDLIGEKMCEFDREVICILHLKQNGIPISCTFASIGTIDSAIFNPRELLKAAVLCNAARVIMVHNHISGNLTPSENDMTVTRRMTLACEIMGIPLLDHIIVGGNNKEFYSFASEGLLQNIQRSKEVSNLLDKYDLQNAYEKLGLVSDNKKTGR